MYSQILQGEGKKLRLHHKMLAEDGTLLATGEQFLLHVSLKLRRTCDPAPKVLKNVEAAALAQSALPDPRQKRG